MTPTQAKSSGAIPASTSPPMGIAMLLGLGVLVNYFDRVNLSVSRDALQDAFGISAVMFGYFVQRLQLELMRCSNFLLGLCLTASASAASASSAQSSGA